MGVYTYADNPLGLKLTPRIEKILKKYHLGEEIDREDIGYLIDEASRFSTFESRVQSPNYKIKDLGLDDEYAIKDVVGQLIMELRHLYATNINTNNVYKMDLQMFSQLYGKINTLTPTQIKTEVVRAINHVKELQKSFDQNGDNLKVVGTFTVLKKDYNFKMEVTVETKVDDVLKEIVKQILPEIEKQAEASKKASERIAQLSEDLN